ncbi:hypothetical protein M4I33_10645 [Clostridium sp. LY3-2]|uniref:hypothetical protein n=1 Tax=Clostridium sp. LY3-2 TaxID=2942482 RepID=UPI0021534B6A|nr:hypothetical protein [Clostridium sp. LY3-2]MCR6515325.1 hypothetical protein [Clostridium sp. LY3-2]
MAERRMFAKTIIDSDAFLDMSLSTQALYFHLSMRADDDGFVNNPKKIQRMIGSGDDELKMLIAKKFIIPFESGICVIKHWRMHNYIRNDRYKETVYTEEKSRLYVEENKAYTLEDRKDTKRIPVVNQKDTKCLPNGIPNVNQENNKNDDTKNVKIPPNIDISMGDDVGIPNDNQLDTQVRLGKDSIGKISIDKDRLGEVKEDVPNLPPLILSTDTHKRIYELVGNVGWFSWFADSEIIEDEQAIRIEVKDDFKRSIIQTKYLSMLMDNFNKRIEVI